MVPGESFRLSEVEAHAFERDGFLGPFDRYLSETEIDQCRAFLDDMVGMKKNHPLYNRFSVRDWHLVSPLILKLFTHQAVESRVASLLGQDIVLWRSKVFYKRVGDGEVGWHQEWGAFNGEEIGNDKPSLIPADPGGGCWDLTVWVALVDVTPENGPLQFVRGSHRKRYPIDMVPMTDSAFFHDPFIDAEDPMEIVRMARESSLVLDIDTSRLFDGIDTASLTMEETKNHVYAYLNKMKAAITLPFEIKPGELATMTMKKGQFVIFTERTMHGSPPNRSGKNRLAVNCRIAKSDTLIYPQRLDGDFIDGSNIDITNHYNILLSGRDRNGKNKFGAAHGVLV